MQSTILGISFELPNGDGALSDAIQYVALGTSDNYSFHRKLGTGKELYESVSRSVNFNEVIAGAKYRIVEVGTTDFTLLGATEEQNVSGGIFTALENGNSVPISGSGVLVSADNRFTTSVDLDGNYGRFKVRIYAENNIGIRSEFIQETIDINPPMYDKTFLVADMFVLYEGKSLEREIVSEPSQSSRFFSASSDFYNREVELRWMLAPPPGHAREGEVLSKELLVDDFFSHFEISIYSGDLKISNEVLDASSLSRSLGTESPSQFLNNYRSFSLNLSSIDFTSLRLTRRIKVKVVSVDKFGRKSSGEMQLINDFPALVNFNVFRDGFYYDFNWESLDRDYRNTLVRVLAIPDGVGLVNNYSVEANAKHFSSLKNANNFKYIKYTEYKNGTYIKYGDGNVYLCLDDLTLGVDSAGNDFDNSPANEEYWQNLGPPVDHFYDNMTAVSGERVQQVWNYNYFYSFTPFDGYGKGDEYIFSGKGISLLGEGKELVAIKTEIKVSNLEFSEINGDDFLFSWDVLDDLSQTVDLSKFSSPKSGPPETIGLSGSLFDIDTGETVWNIVEGNNTKSPVRDKNGEIQTLDDLPAAKIFDSFLYTRDLNNRIYGAGGFPVGTTSFDFTEFYAAEEYVSNFSKKKLYKCISDNNYNGISIPPYFTYWGVDVEYEQGECIEFENSIYKVKNNFNLRHTSSVKGLFNSANSYSVGDMVLCPVGISLFKSINRYVSGDVVLHMGQLYFCIINQVPSYALRPDLYPNHWKNISFADNISYELFECEHDSEPTLYLPAQNGSNWVKSSPGSLSDFFEKIVSPHSLDIKEWSPGEVFYEGEYSVFQNDIWISRTLNGAGTANGICAPGDSSYHWVNELNGQDIVPVKGDGTPYAVGDLVCNDGHVYKCTKNNPTSAPILAITNPGKNTESSYEESSWIPFWEHDTDHISKTSVFGHIGIPQQGKRGVGLEVGILSSFGKILQKERIEAYNPAPQILPGSFSVDTVSSASIVKFDFKYKDSAREKTTKVDVYRSKDPNFEITGAAGFPFGEMSFTPEALQELGNDYTFIKSVAGSSDASFGDNIEQVIDIPTLDVDQDEGSDSFGMQLPTTYYYKLLPYDDFGSGYAYNAIKNYQQQSEIEDQVIAYPKRYFNENPSLPPGPIVRPNPEAPDPSREQVGPDSQWSSVPGPVSSLTGDTAFENYFLNWDMYGVYNKGNNLFKDHINDINHYEVWMSDSAQDSYLKVEGEDSSVFALSPIQNVNGYRIVDGELNSFGALKEKNKDIGDSVVNASKILEVDANSASLEAVYKGQTNDQRYFWVRSVDYAGNKSPFTGVAMPSEHEHNEVSGVELILGRVKATEVADFEAELSKAFPEAISLIPNDPFEDKSEVEKDVNQSWGAEWGYGSLKPKSSSIAWKNHILYKNSVGFYVDANSTEDIFVYWNAPDFYSETKLYEKDDIVIFDRIENEEQLGGLYICVQDMTEEDRGISPLDSTQGSVFWLKIEGGAAFDDYGIKPISSEELIARGLSGIPRTGELTDGVDNPLRDVAYIIKYKSSNHHPAGEGVDSDVDGSGNEVVSSTGLDSKKPKLVKDGHSIIARNVNGVATPYWHTFANALIGTAHIQDAAITNAKIHNLTADKIRSAEIRGQDIQVGGEGQIRSFEFGGLDSMVLDEGGNPLHQQQGFAVSGDGSFVFQNKDGKLFFDGEALTLFGKLKQYNGSEFTFVDLTAEPSSFFYIEQSDGTYIPANRNQYCSLVASFQNSYIDADEVLFEIRNPQGRAFFTYDEFKNSKDPEDGIYRISGFEYNPADFDIGVIDPKGPGTAKVAPAKLSVNGFEDMIRYDNDNSVSILPQDNSVVIFVSGVNSSMQRSIAIDFVADGSSAVYVDLNTENQIFNYDFDGDWDVEGNNADRLELNAQAYNTFGAVRSDFYTGVNLRPENLVKLGSGVFDVDVVNLASIVEGQTYEIAETRVIKANNNADAAEVSMNTSSTNFDYTSIGAENNNQGTKFVYNGAVIPAEGEGVNVLVHMNDAWDVDLFENGGRALVEPLSEQIPRVSMTPFVAKVSVVHENVNLDGLGGKDLLLATDFITVYGQQPGKDSYTVVLGNENHTYPCDEYGRINSDEYPKGATDIIFKRGHTLFNFVPWDPDNHADSNWKYYTTHNDENGAEVIDNVTYTIKDPTLGAIGGGLFESDYNFLKDIKLKHPGKVYFRIEKISRDETSENFGKAIWKSAEFNGDGIVESTQYPENEAVTEAIKEEVGDAVIYITYISDVHEVNQKNVPFFQESFLKIPISDCKYIRNAAGDPQFPPAVFEKNYTFGKAPQGKKGRKIDLVLDSPIVRYDTAGLNPYVSSVTATIQHENFHHPEPRFEFFTGQAGNYVKVQDQSITTSYTLPINEAGKLHDVDSDHYPVTFYVEAYDSQDQTGLGDQEEWVKVAADQATLVSVSRGSNAKLAYQSQEASIIPVTYDSNDLRVPNYSNTENTISVYEGIDTFDYNSTAIAFSELENKQFFVELEGFTLDGSVYKKGNLEIKRIGVDPSWRVENWVDLNSSSLTTSDKINYKVTTKDSDGQLNTYQLVQNIVLGLPAVSTRTVSLESSHLVVGYSSLSLNRNTEGDVYLNTILRNSVGSVKYFRFKSTDSSGSLKVENESGLFVEYTINNQFGGWVAPLSDGSIPQITYTPPESHAGNDVLADIFCEYSEDSSATDKHVLAEDQVSVFALKSGSDTTTIVLTNPAHSIAWDTDNAADVAGSATTLEVYSGATRLIARKTASVNDLNAGEYFVSSTVGSPVSGGTTPNEFKVEDSAETSNALTYPDIASFNTDYMQGTRDFAVTIKKQDGVDVKTVTQNASQTFSLAQSAPPIRQLILSTERMAFNYESQDLQLSPGSQSSVIFTNINNTFGTVFYRFTKSGSGALEYKNSSGEWVDYSSQWSSEIDEVRFVPPVEYSDQNIGHVVCEITEDASGDDRNIEASDQVSFFGLKSGSNAITLVLENEHHGVYWSSYSEDAPVVTGSGSKMYVYQGSELMTPVAKGGDYGNATYPSERGYYFISTTPSAGITEKSTGNISYNSTSKIATIQDLKYYAQSTESAHREITIYLKRKDDTTSTSSSKQTFSLQAVPRPIRSLSASADHLAFNYDPQTLLLENTSDSASISLDYINSHSDANLYYRFTNESGIGQIKIGTTVITNSSTKVSGWHSNIDNLKYIPPSTFSSKNIATIKIEVSEDSGGSLVEASDQISFFGLRGGADSISVILENEFHGIYWTSYNGDAPVVTGSGTRVFVYHGNTLMTPVTKGGSDSDYPSDNGSYFIETSTSLGIAEADSGNVTTGSDSVMVIKDLKSFASNIQSGDRTLSIKLRKENGVVVDISKKQSFALQSDAPPKRVLELEASKLGVAYDSSDYYLLTGNDTVTVTANKFYTNNNETVYYKFSHDGQGSIPSGHDGVWKTGDTVTYSPPPRYENNNILATIKCEIKEGSNGTVLASDQVAIFALVAGSDAITAILSNQYHGLPGRDDLTQINYESSGTDLFVFQGDRKLNRTKATTSENMGEGEFMVVSKTGNHITCGSDITDVTTDEHADHYSYGDHSGLGAKGASITFNIEYKPYNFIAGDPISSVSVAQTLSLNEKGEKGSFTAYRGDWKPDTQYYAAQIIGDSGGRDFSDIVRHNSQYWFALEASSDNEFDENKWGSFSADFENVATSLLLTDASIVKDTITLGEPGDSKAYIQTQDQTFFKAGIVDSKSYFSVGEGFSDGDTVDIRNATLYNASVAGDLIVGGDVLTYQSSDKRLKENIELLNNCLDSIMKIEAVRFSWNEKKSNLRGEEVGLIAQQVKKVLPEVVKLREDGYFGLRYEKLVPLLIGAVQEQQKTIESLSKRLDKLEGN